MIRGDERYWANVVLGAIENLEHPMLMYDGEKMIVRKALKAYLASDDIAEQTEPTTEDCSMVGTTTISGVCTDRSRNTISVTPPSTDCPWK